MRMAPVTIEGCPGEAPNLCRRSHRMKNSTARKLKQIPAGYLIMGVDPHKKKHAAVAMTQDAVVHCKFKVINSKRGYAELLERAQAYIF